MTDREQAVEALKRAGFKPVDGHQKLFYRSSGEGNYGRAIVPFKGDNYYLELRGPLADLPAILSPLTLEMVEKAADEVWSEFKAREDLSVEARDAGIVALERLEALLRQQMGGEQ